MILNFQKSYNGLSISFKGIKTEAAIAVPNLSGVAFADCC